MFYLKNRYKAYLLSDFGAIGVLFAIVLLPLVLMVGLAIDFVLAHNTRSRLQEYADAAALAGARQLLSPKDAPKAITLATHILKKGFYPNGYNAQGQFLSDVSVEEIPKGSVLVVKAQYKLDTHFIRILPKYKQLNIKVIAKALRPMKNRTVLKVHAVYDAFTMSLGRLNAYIVPTNVAYPTYDYRKSKLQEIHLFHSRKTDYFPKEYVFEDTDNLDAVSFRLGITRFGNLTNRSYCRLVDYMNRHVMNYPNKRCPDYTVLDLGAPEPERASYPVEPPTAIANTSVVVVPNAPQYQELREFPALEEHIFYGPKQYTSKSGRIATVWGFMPLFAHRGLVKCTEKDAPTVYKTYYFYNGDVDPLPGAPDRWVPHEYNQWLEFPVTVSGSMRASCYVTRNLGVPRLID